MKIKTYLFLAALGGLMACPATAQNSRRSAQKQRVQQMKEIVKELDLNDNQTALFTELYSNYQAQVDSLRPSTEERRQRRDEQEELTEEQAAARLEQQLNREARRAALKKDLCAQLKEKGFTAVQILKVINYRPAVRNSSDEFGPGRGGFMPPPGGFPPF